MEKASICTPTQLASPHIGRSGPFGYFLARRLTTTHQTVTPTPAAIEIISPRNTAAHHGWLAYAPGRMAGIVFRKDCQGQASSRTQPVVCALYQAVQLPVRAYRSVAKAISTEEIGR